MANILPETEVRGSLQQIYLELKARGISNCKLLMTESRQWLAVGKQQRLSSHAWFNPPSKHCVTVRITRKFCEMFWLLYPASTVSIEYSTGGGGFYSVGSGCPSEDWGKMVLPLQKQVSVSLCCSCKFLSCATIYTHSTTNCQSIHT